MKIIDAVRRQGVSIEADGTVRQAAQLMEQAGVGSLAVLDGGELVGIVTDRDLVRRALAPGLDPSARVDGVMSTPVETVDGETEMQAVMDVFRAKALRRVVVLEDGRFAGVLTIDDLVVDLAADLADLVRPLTAETIFSHHDAPLPVDVVGAS